jgi:hypothetical protein
LSRYRRLSLFSRVMRGVRRSMKIALMGFAVLGPAPPPPPLPKREVPELQAKAGQEREAPP